MNVTRWLDGARPHSSGDTKPCGSCGHTIIRLSHIGAREWNNRRYCSKPCATRASNQQRTPAAVDQHAELLQYIRRYAACTGHWANFVPDSKVEAADAIAVCTGCAVRAECLTYGLATKSFGVWGGELLDPWKPRKTA